LECGRGHAVFEPGSCDRKIVSNAQGEVPLHSNGMRLPDHEIMHFQWDQEPTCAIKAGYHPILLNAQILTEYADRIFELLVFVKDPHPHCRRYKGKDSLRITVLSTVEPIEVSVFGADFIAN
jgi:hypothetical protein